MAHCFQREGAENRFVTGKIVGQWMMKIGEEDGEEEMT